MNDTDIPSETSDESASVLIVEDERQLADLYALWLAETHEVETAYDGEEALAKLDDSVDVVLLDRRMPGMDGDAVLEQIQERGVECRVVMVSAVTPDFDVIELAFDEYLTKPVTADELHDAVKRMLARTDCDKKLQDFYRLTSKKAVLKSEKSDAQLRVSDEYDELLNRIKSLQQRIDETTAKIDDEDLEPAFHPSDSEPHHRSSDTRVRDQ